MVVSTHDTDFAYEFADYIYVLEKGELYGKGAGTRFLRILNFLKKLNLNIPNVLKNKKVISSIKILMKMIIINF